MASLLALCQRILPIAAYLSLSCPVIGAEVSQGVELPKLISLPWRFFNISREFIGAQQADLTAARQAWLQQLGSQSQALASQLSSSVKARLPANLAQALAGVEVATPRQDLEQSLPLTSEPVLCPLGKQGLLVLATLSSLEQERLLGIGHDFIPWPQKGAELTAALLRAGRRAQKQSLLRSPQKTDALQLSLRVGHSLSRHDLASPWCLNLLLSEALLSQGFDVLGSSGLESLQGLKQIYATNKRAARASRSILVFWTQTQGPSHALPVTFNLRATYADAVFASPLAEQLPEQAWQISQGADGALSFPLTADFLDFLKQERSTLAYASPPKISHIDRAWVYADKGRAWGLKLQDRVVVLGQPEQIKGHVVKFFGPELGLRSQAGSVIQEGAIIYVRKGQRQVQLGQEIGYDTTSYPTPWPPSPKP